MYEWYFMGTDSEGQKFAYKVKASDKQTAIKKGMEKVRAKGRTSCRWECKLIRK